MKELEKELERAVKNRKVDKSSVYIIRAKDKHFQDTHTFSKSVDVQDGQGSIDDDA